MDSLMNRGLTNTNMDQSGLTLTDKSSTEVRRITTITGHSTYVSTAVC